MDAGEISKLTNITGKWIFGNLNNFSIRDYYSSPRLVDLIKPMGELILACSLLKKFKIPGLSVTADYYIENAWSELRQGEALHEIIVMRPDLLAMSGVYASFKSNGFTNARLEVEIERISQTPGFFMQDWPAWRRLDLLHGLQSLDFKDDPEIQEVYSKTWLAGCYPLWTLTEGSAYGVTHTIFYMTNYGEYPTGCGASVTQYLTEALPIWTKHYIGERNFDIAAELVMSMCCVGMAKKTSTFLNEIYANKLNDGAIAGPDFGSATLLHGETSEARRYFLHHYHTTLVTFMASVMCDHFASL